MQDHVSILCSAGIMGWLNLTCWGLVLSCCVNGRFVLRHVAWIDDLLSARLSCCALFCLIVCLAVYVATCLTVLLRAWTSCCVLSCLAASLTCRDVFAWLDSASLSIHWQVAYFTWIDSSMLAKRAGDGHRGQELGWGQGMGRCKKPLTALFLPVLVYMCVRLRASATASASFLVYFSVNYTLRDQM